jgi:hypothetical protein
LAPAKKCVICAIVFASPSVFLFQAMQLSLPVTALYLL